MRILLIEDEPFLGEAVREHVAAHGHAVDWVKRLDEAEVALRSVPYDLALLDLHLPDGRGLDLLQTVRKAGNTRPVIILTARDQISDRIAGLNAGADDYLVKPFDLDELIARLLAVGRRYNGDPSPHFVRGGVDVDRAGRRVAVDGRDVVLTRREWAVLDQLLQRPGATVAKARIEDALYEFGAEVESNAVEVFVSRLTEKLLQLARAEAGVALDAGRVDLMPVLRLLAEEYARRPDVGRRLQFDTAGLAHLWVRADADAAGIAVQNLLDNALAHGSGDGPIRFSAGTDGVIRVANESPVVAPETLPRLVQRFARGHTAGLGSGLGLAIVDAIMCQSGGSLELLSPATGRTTGFEAVLRFRAANAA